MFASFKNTFPKTIFKWIEDDNLIVQIVQVAIIGGVSYAGFTYALNRSNSSSKQKLDKKQGKKNLKLFGKENLDLTEHELIISSQLILPEEITVSWKDIAGLDDILREISETVVFPIKESWITKKSKLARPPKGVLLHGPPGCGKTMIAKAVAKQAVTAFINVDISMLTDKWYGESQKLVDALFSFALKIQPCIIFIDEIDSLLRSRSSQDHEATAMMKAQFMFLWDGLSTDSDKTVIVMGATNRPQDLDAAIRRRMPATFFIPMPALKKFKQLSYCSSINTKIWMDMDPLDGMRYNFRTFKPSKIYPAVHHMGEEQRKEIITMILKKENTVDININELVERTKGFSGSDLEEMCRQAVLFCFRDCARQSERKSVPFEKLRPICMNDFLKVIESMINARSASKNDSTD